MDTWVTNGICLFCVYFTDIINGYKHSVIKYHFSVVSGGKTIVIQDTTVRNIIWEINIFKKGLVLQDKGCLFIAHRHRHAHTSADSLSCCRFKQVAIACELCQELRYNPKYPISTSSFQLPASLTPSLPSYETQPLLVLALCLANHMALD